MNYKRTRLSIFSYGILTFLLLGYLLHVHAPLRPTYSWPPPEFSYDYEKEELLDQDQSCQFANLNPFDPSILPHIADANPILCKQRFHLLTLVDDRGTLRFNRTALSEAGYDADAPSLTCHYRPLVRVGDDRVEYGEPVSLPSGSSGVPLPSSAEFVGVDCRNFVGVTVYSNLHARVFAKRNRTNGVETTSATGNAPLNVVFVIIDSQSHSNFVRQLPKTYSQLTRDLGATVLRGFTTVGDNTYPNLVALLSGRPTMLFPELIQQNGVAGRRVFDSHGPYDQSPLLFHELSRRRGYATLLAEDISTYAIFNYYADGFTRPPAHHYLRPFWLALESHNTHYLSSNLCFGSRPKHLLQLDYLEDFMRVYSAARVPYFAFAVFTEIGHDFMNQVGATDQDFASFLARIRRDGLLDDTMLVVMGDHGNRMSSILETPVGRMEKRRPFGSVYLPERYKRAHPHLAANLRTNAKRLTNVFDLHWTVLQVTDPAAELESSLVSVAAGVNETSTESSEVDVAGVKLDIGDTSIAHFGTTLLGPISAARTCPEAGIPFQYCACDKEMSVSADDGRVREAGLAIVQAINNHTEPYRSLCAVLSLKRIAGAVILLPHDIDLRRGKKEQPLPQPDDFLSGGAGDFKLRITVLVSPSEGLFEAMVLVAAGDSSDGSVQVVPGVSRMNAYGAQPDCIVRRQQARPSLGEDHSLLKTYCYCRSNLPST